MTYTLRPYQQEASDAAVNYFLSDKKEGALLILPTGAGKSLVIADIANRIGEVLVFCPNKEILEQNHAKLLSYGETQCSVYSASLRQKKISKVTFATIGSVRNVKELFAHYKYIIVDEAHLVNPKHGMYKDFFDSLSRSKVVGLTATPYRLHTTLEFGSSLKFITRTRPRIFHDVIYHVQIQHLLDLGYLSRLEYFSCPPPKFDRRNLFANLNGSDFTSQSIRREYLRTNMQLHLVDIVMRLLHPKSGEQRKGILVFTRFVEEAEYLASQIQGAEVVTGDTPKDVREDIINRFRTGEVKVVCNANVLTTGFDYPELDTIVIARPTMSLALYYQIVGRAIRPHPDKPSAWIVDLCGNYQRFGRVETLKLDKDKKHQWCITQQGHQLTNVPMH